MLFIYKARDPQGALISGEMTAINAIAAKYTLAERGLFPTSVESKKFTFSFGAFLEMGKKRRAKDLISLTRQFYALFKGGVNIDRILFNLSKQATHAGLRSTLEQIRSDVSSGLSLSSAFQKHPIYFNELYVNMLRVGEQGGVMEQSLGKLADILRKEHKLMSNVKSATLYPKIVIFVFIAVVALMLIYVVPRFADFYSGFQAALPLPTRILMAASDFMISYWYIVAAMFVAGFIGLRRLKTTDKGMFFLDGVKFKTPVFGALNKLVVNARFGHLMAALYKSGMPLAHALEVVSRTIGNKVFQKEVEGMASDVAKGTGLSSSMGKRPMFTMLMTETAAVGEETGSLDEMLESTAQFYDEEIDTMLDQLTTLIEPLLLVGIFGMVMLLALAIFLPWWNVTRLVLQGGGG